MAKSRVCSIPDCGKKHLARGWCREHYRRWLEHNDPLGGRVRRGTAHLAMEKAIAEAMPDDCWLWPYAKSPFGYGVLRIDGRLHRVHRVICERVNGKPPSQTHVAAHTCGKGNLGCVNPHHVRWATQTENMADCVVHGTVVRGERQHCAKLTAEQVDEIRSRYAAGGVLQRELAAEYDISREEARDIINGKRWGWMDGFVEPPVTNLTRRARSKSPKGAFGPVAK